MKILQVKIESTEQFWLKINGQPVGNHFRVRIPVNNYCTRLWNVVRDQKEKHQETFFNYADCTEFATYPLLVVNSYNSFINYQDSSVALQID